MWQVWKGLHRHKEYQLSVPAVPGTETLGPCTGYRSKSISVSCCSCYFLKLICFFNAGVSNIRIHMNRSGHMDRPGLQGSHRGQKFVSGTCCRIPSYRALLGTYVGGRGMSNGLSCHHSLHWCQWARASLTPPASNPFQSWFTESS